MASNFVYDSNFFCRDHVTSFSVSFEVNLVTRIIDGRKRIGKGDSFWPTVR